MGAPPLVRLARACASFSTVVGAAILAAHAIGLTEASALFPGWPKMVENTALLAVFTGISLFLQAPPAPSRRARWSGRALAAAALLNAAAGLGGHALEVGGFPFAPLSAHQTLAAFLLLGFALLGLDLRLRSGRRPASALAAGAGSIAFIAAVGLLFDVTALFGVIGSHPLIGMSIPTALVLLASSVGVLVARPGPAVLGLLSSGDLGGIAARRLYLGLSLFILSAIAVALGAQLGWYGPAMAAALLTFVGFAVGAATIVATSSRLEREVRSRRETEERWQSLVQQASDGIFLADLQGRYVDVNEAGCRMLGFRKDELLGKSIEDLLPPDELDRFRRSKVAIFEGQVHVAEWHLRRADGSYQPSEVSAKLLPGGRWQGFVRDVSERRRLTETLHEKSDELERAQAVAGVGSWRLDLEKDELSLSAENYRIFGVASGTPMTYEDFTRLVHPDDRDRVDRKWKAALRGEPYDIEHRLLVAGAVRWVQERAAFEFDVRGRPVRAIGTTQDITERKRTELILRRLAEQERFRLALESAATGLLVVARDGSITFANEEALRIFGYSRKELTGLRVEALLPEGSRGAHPGQRASFFEEHPGKRIMGAGRRLRALRKDGVEIPVEVGLARVMDGGQDFVVASVQDISERVHAEEAMRRSMTELESFAYTISHDLRSPLRAVQGYASVLRERLSKDLAPEDRDLLERISTAAVRLDSLIRDLLSFSAISREPIRIGRVSLDTALEHVTAHYPELRAGRLEVLAPLGWVAGQESLVIQVLSNLLRNAVKFMPPGREPRIRIRTERPSAGKLRLVVEDNGVGVPRDSWEEVFKPFVRLHSKGAFEGTGIGLALVRKAVERMEGRVWLESEPDQGTRVFIELREA